ncbi:hypothetical protein SDC9_201193 [bioreactor metagenome]|uniref:Uncharacterized protein n=1 Tax=bioreactor metagenome TaxID=1076179 RepID=A0A645IT16_9ZZZZ
MRHGGIGVVGFTGSCIGRQALKLPDCHGACAVLRVFTVSVKIGKAGAARRDCRSVEGTLSLARCFGQGRRLVAAFFHMAGGPHQQQHRQAKFGGAGEEVGIAVRVHIIA